MRPQLLTAQNFRFEPLTGCDSLDPNDHAYALTYAGHAVFQHGDKESWLGRSFERVYRSVRSLQKPELTMKMRSATSATSDPGIDIETLLADGIVGKKGAFSRAFAEAMKEDMMAAFWKAI